MLVPRKLGPYERDAYERQLTEMERYRSRANSAVTDLTHLVRHGYHTSRPEAPADIKNSVMFGALGWFNATFDKACLEAEVTSCLLGAPEAYDELTITGSNKFQSHPLQTDTASRRAIQFSGSTRKNLIMVQRLGAFIGCYTLPFGVQLSSDVREDINEKLRRAGPLATDFHMVATKTSPSPEDLAVLEGKISRTFDLHGPAARENLAGLLSRLADADIAMHKARFDFTKTVHGHIAKAGSYTVKVAARNPMLSASLDLLDIPHLGA